jgi:hypothetical protein
LASILEAKVNQIALGQRLFIANRDFSPFVPLNLAAINLPEMARSKECRADVLDQFDNVIRLVCSAASMIAKWIWRVRAIVVMKDGPGDRKTISRPVSGTVSKLAQIRNANQ